MWRCPGILETFQGLFGNLGSSTPIKGPMHLPCICQCCMVKSPLLSFTRKHRRRCEKHAPSSIQLVGWWTSISTRQQLCLAPRGEQKYWLARALPHLEHLSSSNCPPVEKDWYLKPFRSEIFTLSMKMDVHLVRLDPMWAKNLHFVSSCLWNLKFYHPLLHHSNEQWKVKMIYKDAFPLEYSV